MCVCVCVCVRDCVYDRVCVCVVEQNPVHRHQVGDAAVNRLRWSPDARFVAAGNTAGATVLLRVPTEVRLLCVCRLFLTLCVAACLSVCLSLSVRACI